MKTLFIILSVYLLFEGGDLYAEEAPTEIIAPQRAEKPYEVGELICVDTKTGETECGKVTQAGTDVVHISLESIQDGIEFLDGTQAKEEPKPKVVEKASKKAKRELKKADAPPTTPVKEVPPPSPLPVAEMAAVIEPAKNISCTRSLAALAKYQSPSIEASASEGYVKNRRRVALFGSFGLDYYLVGPELQQPVAERWAATFAPFFSAGSSATTSVLAYGAYTRFIYRPFIETPNLYVTPALGIISIRSTVNISENKYSLTALALAGTIGYRMDFDGNFFVAFEAGLQHLSALGGDSRRVDFQGVKPVTFLQFGMSLL